MAPVQVAVAAGTVGHQRQNKNERPDRLRAWREMAASARMEGPALIAQPGVVRAMARDEGGARVCAMAQALAAQMALVPWQPQSLLQNSRLHPRTMSAQRRRDILIRRLPSDSRPVSLPDDFHGRSADSENVSPLLSFSLPYLYVL